MFPPKPSDIFPPEVDAQKVRFRCIRIILKKVCAAALLLSFVNYAQNYRRRTDDVVCRLPKLHGFNGPLFSIVGGIVKWVLRLHYTRLFPDPRFLLFVLQNIAGYKNKCG